MKNILVVMALKEESQGLFEANGVYPLYTGVGKINATYALTKYLIEFKANSHFYEFDSYDLVLNLGTAGSKNFERGTIVECFNFIQNDMDARGLGFARGVTPFDEDKDNFDYRDFKHGLNKYPLTYCYTSDTFQTNIHFDEFINQAHDMEAYALWKVCRQEGVPFKCFKYISDNGDESSPNDWNNSLKDSSKKLFEVYKKVKMELG